MKLDKRSSVPLYAQLKECLAERIESGEYKPGDKIPTELALCAELELSRPTVRQAIAELVAEGLLYIVKGRGTFVSEQTVHQLIHNYDPGRFDLFHEPECHEEPLYRRILDYKKVAKPSVELLRTLGLESGTHPLIRVEWVEETEDFPYAYCIAFLPQSYYPDLLTDLRAHVDPVTLLVHARQAIPKSAEAKLSLRPSNADEVRYLDLMRAAPVLVHEALFRLEDERPCMLVTAAVEADRCAFQLPPVTLPYREEG